MSLSNASAQFRAITKDLGELVEKHERAKGLDSFQKYEDDLPAFAWDYFRVKLWDKQLDIWQAIQTETMVSVSGGNGVGKDHFSAVASLHHAICKRGLVILTAATQRQAIEVCMGEVHRLFNRAKELPGELFRSALRIESDEPCGIIAMASTEASRLTGFHAPRILAVLSEAQALEPWVLEAFLSCAVGDEDKLLAVGNPLFPSGWFHETSRSPMWTHIQVPATEHPNVTEGRIVIPGGPTRQWVEKMRLEYGEGSNTYRSRVLAEPPDEGEEAMFRRSWLDAAAERWAEAMAKIEFDRQGGREKEPLIACDPARYGPDSTVCALRRGNVLESLVEWRNTDTQETAAKVREEALKAGFNDAGWGEVIVDEIGVGSGVLDGLHRLGINAYGFNGGRPPHDRNQFLNSRAESYWELRVALEEGSIALPDDPKLFDELLALQWRPTADGKVQLEAKDQLKSRLGRSPDRADAVSMAFYPYAIRRLVIGTFRI